MLKVDCTYTKENREIRHVGADQTFVPPKLGTSLRLSVWEAPGEEEGFKGIPAIGAAGKFGDSLYKKAGVSREELTILNCVNCRPPNNKFPGDPGSDFYISKQDARKVVEHCYNAHVKPVIDSKPWTRIDALGAHALKVLTGKNDITKWRGSPLPLKDEVKVRVIPTLHPSFIMIYGQGFIPVVVSDLKKGTTLPPEYYNTKPTLDDVASFRSTKLALDIETNRFSQQIICVGLSDKPYHAMCVPFQGAYIAEIKRIIENAEEIITHNGISFDMPRLCAALKIKDLKAREFDTILAQHLVMPDAPHDLGFVGSVFLQKPYWKDEIGEDMFTYCCKDVDGTFQIAQQLKPILKAQNLEDLYWYTQVPLAKICHLMETTGIHTSGKRAQEIRTKLLTEIESLESALPEGLKPYDKSIRVRQLAPAGTLGKSGKPIKFTHIPGTERVTPWTSPKQVERFLYQTLSLPEQYHSKTKKLTTDKIALEKLITRTLKSNDIETHRTLQSLRKLRSLDELASSFVKGMKDEDGKDIPIKDGIVAPHFSPYGTCLSPKTRVCTSDLRWIAIEEVKRGDTLIGFDEEGIWRKLHPSKVESTEKVFLPSFELEINRKKIIASADHCWLVEKKHHPKGQGRFVWKATKDIAQGDRIAFWKSPWDYRASRDAGFLAAFFDSEGNLDKDGSLHGTQKENPLLKEVIAALSREGITHSDPTPKDDREKEVKGFYVVNGIAVIGSLRSPRLLANSQRTWENKSAFNKKNLEEFDSTVRSIKPVGLQELVSLKTSTRTFIAEGLLSHNSGGRLSSSGPNMQNQPPAARFIYVPSNPEWCLIEADFSQGENRLTAWYANDQERLQRLSTPGFSEHKLNAEIFFGVPYAEVVKDNSPDAPYGRAKKLTHGINYGEGPRKIAMNLDLPEKDVRDWLFKWKQANRPTVEWMEKVSKEAEHTGVLTNVFGRKRWFWTQRLYGESLSFLPQSTLADICFRAMIGLMYERINWPIELALKASPILAPLPLPAKLLLQVHDSLVIEAPKELVPEVIKCLKAVMEQPWAQLGGFNVPAEVKAGKPNASWGELE